MTTVSRLSDADILYYAAQNSAKKRKLKRVLSELENQNPNECLNNQEFGSAGGDYENHQNDKIACEESFSKTLFPPNTVTLHDPAYKSTETFGNNGEIDLKVLFLGKLLHFVNNAPYDELVRLRGIGKKRALLILTERNSGAVFRDISDLQNVGIAPKSIRKFTVNNVGTVLGL